MPKGSGLSTVHSPEKGQAIPWQEMLLQNAADWGKIGIVQKPISTASAVSEARPSGGFFDVWA